MLYFTLNLIDPSKNSYYYPILISITAVLLLIHIMIKTIRRLRGDEYFDLIYNDPYISLELPLNFELKKNILKYKYLLAYIITRSAMWAKAPYLYVINYNIQKFSYSEMAILCIIEIIIGYLFSPIYKYLKNRYDLKFLCIFYIVTVVINLLLLMQSSHFMIYLSQIIKGFGANIISNTFEEWVILESVKVFQGYPKLIEIFIKRLLLSSNKYDAEVSIITPIICSFIYSYVGIYGPLCISIVLYILSIVVIQVLWDENQIKISAKNSSLVPLREVLFEFKEYLMLP